MRTFLATIAGLLIGGIVIWGIEELGHQLFPVPFKVDPNNLDDLRNLMLHIPVEALISIIVAHSVGVFTGMAVARVIDKKTIIPMYIIAGLILLSTGLNLMVLPHPLWFSIADVAGVLIVSLLFIRSVKKN